MKLIKYAIYILGFCFLIGICFQDFNQRVLLSSANNLKTVDVINGTLIKQDFIVEHNNMDGVGIHTATGSQLKMDGILTMQLNLNDKLLIEKDVEIKDFFDNVYYYIDIPLQTNSKGKKYQLVIKGKQIPEEATLKLYANKVSGNDVIHIGYYYKEKDSSLILYLVLYFWMIMLIEVLNKKDTKGVKK